MTDNLYIRVIVLSFCEDDINILSSRLQTKINKLGNKHPHFQYGSGCLDWQPFESSLTIGSILEKQRNEIEEKLSISLVEITEKFPKTTDLEDVVKNKLMEFFDDPSPCLLILDYMILESPKFKLLVRKIDDLLSKKVGCIAPISDNLPSSIKKRFDVLKQKNLQYFYRQYKSGKSTVHLNVVDYIEFERALKNVVKEFREELLYHPEAPNDLINLVMTLYGIKANNQKLGAIPKM